MLCRLRRKKRVLINRNAYECCCLPKIKIKLLKVSRMCMTRKWARLRNGYTAGFNVNDVKLFKICGGFRMARFGTCKVVHFSSGDVMFTFLNTDFLYFYKIFSGFWDSKKMIGNAIHNHISCILVNWAIHEHKVTS